MAHGLRIYGANGVLVHDTTDRLTRIIGSTVISGSGSFEVPDFSFGEGWCFTQPLSNFNGTFSSYPEVTISGTTISWTTDSPFPTSVILYYGVY